MHRRFLLLAFLFVTLPFALVALVPDASTNVAPVKPLPATGGPTEVPGPVKDKVADKTDAPVRLAKVKPITFNAERDADVARVVGTLLEQRHYLQTPISPEMSQRWLKNYLSVMVLELQTVARACGKSHVHNLEPDDLVALTVEAAAMAGVPLAGTDWIPGRSRY